MPDMKFIADDEDDALDPPDGAAAPHHHLAFFYGDLLLPSPSWVSYSPQAQIVGRHSNFLPTSLEDRWMLRPAILDAHCRRDPGRPRVLILNYPSNPIGQNFSRDEPAASPPSRASTSHRHLRRDLRRAAPQRLGAGRARARFGGRRGWLVRG